MDLQCLEDLQGYHYYFLYFGYNFEIHFLKLLKMETFLKIENIKLWTRVGVLDEERELGQLFILDIFLWTDFEKCTVNDDIEKTVDYSKLVQILKDQS